MASQLHFGMGTSQETVKSRIHQCDIGYYEGIGGEDSVSSAVPRLSGLALTYTSLRVKRLAAIWALEFLWRPLLEVYV